MPRRGFTLLELMLVLLILVIAAALTAPWVESMMTPGKRIAAQDKVREVFAQMTTHAMTDNRPYRFSVKENTGEFRVIFDDALDPNDNAEIDMVNGLNPEGTLPDGVFFVKDPGALLGSTEPMPGSEWETLAVILPDGTAKADADIMFAVKGEEAITLHLRALTGVLRIVDNVTKEEIKSE